MGWCRIRNRMYLTRIAYSIFLQCVSDTQTKLYNIIKIHPNKLILHTESDNYINVSLFHRLHILWLKKLCLNYFNDIVI